MQQSSSNHENDGKTDNVRWMHYSEYAVLSVCCTQCMLYWVYAVLGGCCTGCMLYSVNAELGVCCVRCMLYLVLTYDHGMESLGEMTKLGGLL
jgi:hypothetical protein